MRTEKQQETSRKNGAQSQGPVTPEGKDRSSQNSTRHGIFSEALLLKPENRGAWHRLADTLIKRFKPADDVEMSVIFDMAATTWRKERALNMEAALINQHYDVIDRTDAPARTEDDEMRRCAMAYAEAVGHHKATIELGRIVVRLTNLWMRLHRKLKELQADRKAEEAETATPAEAPKPKVGNEPGEPATHPATPEPTQPDSRSFTFIHGEKGKPDVS